MQNLMIFHLLLFKILRKSQRVTDGRTDGRTDGKTDNVKTVYQPKTPFCGVYNKCFTVRTSSFRTFKGMYRNVIYMSLYLLQSNHPFFPRNHNGIQQEPYGLDQGYLHLTRPDGSPQNGRHQLQVVYTPISNGRQFVPLHWVDNEETETVAEILV